MSGALYLPGADRTSRWFFKAGAYPGQALMPRIDKTLLHSTETQKTSGCPGYSGGATAPQLTLNPWTRKAWQHFPLNRAGRALMNPASTPVSENKDNVVQIEIIGFSDPALGRKYNCYLPELPDSGLDWLAEQIAFIHREWPHPTTLPPTWPLYKVSSWPAMNAARMSSREYDDHRGILAHLHASGNNHSDVAIKIQSLKGKIDRLLTGGAPNLGGIRLGDRGAEVIALQKLLIAAGQNIVADGSFGPATEAALRAFQKSKGLTVDGIAWPSTIAALKAATAPATPAPVATKEITVFALVQIRGLDPVYKSDGFRLQHIGKRQLAALKKSGLEVIELADQVELDAYGVIETNPAGQK